MTIQLNIRFPKSFEEKTEFPALKGMKKWDMIGFTCLNMKILIQIQLFQEKTACFVFHQTNTIYKAQPISFHSKPFK